MKLRKEEQEIEVFFERDQISLQTKQETNFEFAFSRREHFPEGSTHQH